MDRKIYVVLVLALCLCLTGCNSGDYKKASDYMESGDYTSALEIFETLAENNYKDSADLAAECEEMISAIETYEASLSAAEEKNSELEAAISEADALIENGNPVLDEIYITSLESASSSAKAVMFETDEIPDTAEEILSLASEMDSIDYTDVLEELSTAYAALEKAISRYNLDLVYCPTEAYVISCLETVSGIMEISAVTEDNDPNGNLNKDGGYTAQVYFSYELVDQDSVYGSSVIEKGTDCGGSIEVYSSVEDAVSREEYLASFDGTILSSGSHVVIGTIVVRTSDELTASQQNELEYALIAALTNIEEEAAVEETTAEEESHIYDDAEIIDIMNGAGTSVVSQESLIYADSSEITIEVLEDWYFNYIKETEYDWYVIIYTDGDDYTGIYGTSGYIEVGVTFEESSDEVFMESSTANSTMYVATEERTLEEK